MASTASTISSTSFSGNKDGVSSDFLPPPPLCIYGVRARLRTSNTSGNPGRGSMDSQGQSKFFQWLDPPVYTVKMVKSEEGSTRDGEDIAGVFRKLKMMEEHLQRMVENQKKIDAEIDAYNLVDTIPKLKMMDEQLERVVEHKTKYGGKNEINGCTTSKSPVEGKSTESNFFCLVGYFIEFCTEVMMIAGVKSVLVVGFVWIYSF
ncbi:hypothetical protein CJ030_MR4G013742 [Morella rubra]|uniref:Uncharacterized protein n=1 Tax=Morella rubra TaxID=262757 RepID=A0A6A1X037_9ROSI|nr:hypothetical protein CJ030_MR4G013742 [Morella rubra]